jgi:hypothetical protein
MKPVYVILWSIVALLSLPVLAFIVMMFGPAVFVFLLIAAFAAPMLLLLRW